MTKDDIIRMAREAWKHDCFSLWQKHQLESLVDFANLVAAAEREECAKIAEEPWKRHPREIGEAIRARGQNHAA